MKKVTESYQVVVCGGGLAGFCSAVASARMGKKTCIIQNRPVFGGNSSSEIGVTPHGAAAFHAYARETGILSELLIEERAANHAEIYENGWTNSVWDLVMYDMAEATKNLSYYMNTDFFDVHMEDKTIKSIVAHIQNAETELTLEADVFIDCTGDGLVADRAGCEWRMGSESKAEFNEPHAPDEASDDVMGNSIHFRAKNIGKPAPYTAPDWAIKHDNPDYFYKQGRIPKEEKGGFWWLEIGVPYHTIYDNEKIRHELTRHTLGIWDWMKNQDPVMKKKTKNYVLDWIGQVPGKRENRRIMGEYFMTEHDVLDKTVFDDEIAFGGWFVDLHTPGGLLAEHAEKSSATYGGEYNTFSEYMVMSYCGPYGVPLRSLIAKDATNLMMAGRNISTTHAALGTLRVMGTTALMGQAAGVAAAIAIDNGVLVKELSKEQINQVKQQLLRDGCFLPNNKNEDKRDLALKAKLSASSEMAVYGAGPDSIAYHEGLSIWRDQPQFDLQTLTIRKGLFVAIGEDRLDTISVCLTNESGITQKVTANIYAAEHIWDYVKEPGGKALVTAELDVPVGEKVWVDWNVELTTVDGLPKGRFIRLDLDANEELKWLPANGVVPGHMGVYQIGENKMRRFSNGETLSFKVSPAQKSFGPSETLSGVTRPYKSTNLWKSDPAQTLPQWINLTWDSSQKIETVEITFPGHLLREYHAYAPFYRDAQCPKDYLIQVKDDDSWRTVEAVKENYQRRRVHVLSETVTSNSLRIVVESTNGDPSAAIYEVRCY